MENLEERIEDAVIVALCLRASGMLDFSDTSLIYKISEELEVEFDIANKVFTRCLCEFAPDEEFYEDLKRLIDEAKE